MAIVRDDQLGSVNMTTPKVVLVEVTPSPTARAVSTNVVACVFQATRGERGKVYTIGSLTEFEKTFGHYDSTLDGYLWTKRFFDANGSILKGVRAMSSGGVKAFKTINDGALTPVDLFTITFSTEGTCGNFTTIKTVVNPLDSNYFNITISNSKTGETLTYTKTTLDNTDARYLGTLIQNDPNKFFSFTFIADGTPAYGTFSLATGSNGTTTGSGLSDSEYVGTDSGSGRTGIQSFKASSCEDVSIVVSARSTSTINTALITHVEDITLSPRRTIISLPAGTTVASAITAKTSIDSDKVKISFPMVKVQNPFTLENETVSSNAFDSAMDTLLSYHQSASQTAYPVTVAEAEIDLSPTEIDQLTTVQINPIVFKSGKGFIRASDYTTSSNPSLKQNVVRKAKDYFARVFYDLLQNYISKPITPALWAEIKSVMEAFLRIEQANGRIGSTTGGKAFGVKIDAENNPQSIVQQNKIIIYCEISLLAPADIIIMYLDARQDKTIVNA